ncbi:MAG: tyrosine-type recombinase/integrase [Phycisphaerae bacterium]
MPYAHHIPSYRRHRSTGQAVVTINGRDFYLGPYGCASSRREYDRLIAEWQLGGRTLPAVGVSIAELMLAYAEHLKQSQRNVGGRAGGTELSAWICAVRPLKRLYARLPAAEFGPLKLQAVREEHIKAGLARVTCNSQTRRIVRMFKWAVSRELVPVTVYQALKAVEGLRRGKSAARETEPVKPVAWSTVEATLPFVNSHVAAMIRLQWLTGMRSGEVCRMSMADLDMSGDLWIYRPRLHKTAALGHARIIPLGPQSQDVLRPLLKAASDACLFSPADAEAQRRAAAHASRKTPLSCGNRPGSHVRRHPKKRPGVCYSPDSYKGAIDYGIRKANAARAAALGVAVDELPESERVPHWHPHQLRHAAATRIRKQYGLDAARAVLGHKSLAITEVYAEQDATKAEEVAKSVG